MREEGPRYENELDIFHWILSTDLDSDFAKSREAKPAMGCKIGLSMSHLRRVYRIPRVPRVARAAFFA